MDNFNYKPGVEAIPIKDTSPYNTPRTSKTGSYDSEVISRIVNSALNHGINPYYALGLAMKESNLGNAGSNRFLGMEANPFQVNEIYWPDVMSMPGNVSNNFVNYAMKNLVKPGYERFSNPIEAAQHFHRPNISKWNDFTKGQAEKAVAYSNMLQENPQINALVNSRMGELTANTFFNPLLKMLGGNKE